MKEKHIDNVIDVMGMDFPETTQLMIQNQETIDKIKKLIIIYKNLGKPTKGTPDYIQGTIDMKEKVIDDLEKILIEQYSNPKVQQE